MAQENRIEYYIEFGEGCKGIPSYRVFSVQNDLYYLGYLKNRADGSFGPNTLKAVNKAQRDLGYEVNKKISAEFRAALAAETIYTNPEDR